MKAYIDKAAIVAEIERRRDESWLGEYTKEKGIIFDITDEILSFIDTLEVKEVDEQKERMRECPYRQVGCKMYEGKILECNGACGWIVDHLNLKELKTQKGE